MWTLQKRQLWRVNCQSCMGLSFVLMSFSELSIAPFLRYYHLFLKTPELVHLCSSASETREAGSVAGHEESAVKVEVMHYLDNHSNELSSLRACAHVKAAFVKCNTTLPFTAPVEWLFSIGGLIATPQRNRFQMNYPAPAHAMLWQTSIPGS